VLASKVKVILVDSRALGQAPLQVVVEPRSLRQLTLSIPEESYPSVARAKMNKALIITYKNKAAETVAKPTYRAASKPKSVVQKSDGLFQALTLIQGTKKEILDK
jgi:hypothetical protein